MRETEGRQTLRLAVGAALAGFAWGYVRHRADSRRSVLALTQAAEWFVACGGAATLIDLLRDLLHNGAGRPDEVTERVTHATQTTTDRAAR